MTHEKLPADVAALLEGATTPLDGPIKAAGRYVAVARTPDGTTATVELTGKRLFGSASECDVVLDNASVSRRHVTLTAGDGWVTVEDLGSTNGTLYMGHRIERVQLAAGARLTVGRCTIDILPEPEAGSAPLSARDGYGDLRGTGVAMRRLYAMLELLEETDAPVWIEGETGTGKELVARAIHQHGGRAEQPFIVIDCGRMPADLVDSELFGHRKGAFTGAIGDTAGAFGAAHGGTIFLDEIGELPLELQPKLLRALETGEIRAVGDDNHRTIDVRFLCATNRDLKAMVDAGTFRSDLYYRIAVVRVTTPALREHPEDIPLIANVLATSIDANHTELPPGAIDFLNRQSWPGNVRELRNAVQQLLVFGHSQPLAEPIPAPTAVRADGPLRPARRQALEDFERRYLEDLMARADNNISTAAQAASVERKYLRSLLRKHGLYKAPDGE